MYLICLKENISEMYVRKWWLYCTYPAVYCIALSCHAPSSWTATDKYNRALIIWQKIIVAYDTVRNYFQMCWWWVQGISFLKLSGEPWILNSDSLLLKLSEWDYYIDGLQQRCYVHKTRFRENCKDINVINPVMWTYDICAFDNGTYYDYYWYKITIFCNDVNKTSTSIELPAINVLHYMS